MAPRTELLPVAKLAHNLERTLFKYIFYLVFCYQHNSLALPVLASIGFRILDPTCTILHLGWNGYPKSMILPLNDLQDLSRVLATRYARAAFFIIKILTVFFVQDLRALAKQEDKKFSGSTSSLSGMLSHIYFLLSEYKEADCSILSQHFKNEVCTVPSILLNSL